jgi:plasmid maintenance system antidote protein VapI
MAKDKRYNTLKKLIEVGATTSISEILEVVPKTVIGNDMGMHHQTFNKLVNSPENFTVKNIFRIATLIGVEKMTMLNLIAQDILTRDSKRKK